MKRLETVHRGRGDRLELRWGGLLRRLFSVITVLLLIPPYGATQESKTKRVMIFPFKIIESGGTESFSMELAGTLGAELQREGDVEVLSGKAFESLVQPKTVDPARMARLAGRAEAVAMIWGTVSRLDDGRSLEVWAMGRDERKKPRLITMTAKDMDELGTRMKDLAAEIGSVVLNRPKVAEIKIEGNRRIQKDAILNKIHMKVGSPFQRSLLGSDIRELYSMGYFDDVQIKAEETPVGEINLHILLRERPSIKTIEVTGNKKFSKDEILDAITTKSLTVASVAKIREDINKLKKQYEKDGYYQPQIDYEIKELSRDEAKLIFKIQEGQQSYLQKIAFEGRQKLTEKELKKILTVQEKSWLWLLDQSGTFTSEKLDECRIRLIAYYLDHGFMNVQVGQPNVDIQGRNVTVTFPIREGERFQVRKVQVEGEGDLLVPKEKLEAGLQTKPKTWYKRTSVAEDIKGLTRLYNNMGYAFADVEPRPKINDKYQFVDIVYWINKGQQVRIERVDIVGNERTRDKVIRRSVKVSEGDLFNADRLEASKSMLEQMDYFDSVRIKTAPGSKPDLMNLTVEVAEKKTGSLSAGVGYSSQDGAMGNINLKERNLFGLGIVADGKANISGRKNSYNGMLTYPYMFDRRLYGSIRGYKDIQKETHYVRDGEGFGVNIGFPFPFLETWQVSTGLGRDSAKISGIERGFGRSVEDYYRKYNKNPAQYMNVSDNSFTTTVSKDTRDSGMIPTQGSRITFTGRFSGLGGDVTYGSLNTEGTYYYQVYPQVILKAKVTGSMLQEIGTDPIPFDRRLQVGGAQTIRGWRGPEIGPRDKYGYILGGDRAAVANLECLFPLVPQMKLHGVVFADAGNAWNASDSLFTTDIKAGYGAGVRWVSPMGPLRIEYGWKINPDKGEDKGAFVFTMGQLF